MGLKLGCMPLLVSRCGALALHRAELPGQYWMSVLISRVPAFIVWARTRGEGGSGKAAGQFRAVNLMRGGA